MAKQLRNFRIRYSRKEGSDSHDGDSEWLFNKLDAEREGRERNLEPKQLFSLVEPRDTSVLVNLKKKATPTFVKLALGQALGPAYSYTVELVETIERGEKFVPGEREAEGRCRSTIEREANEVGGGKSATFVLVDATCKTTYSYDGRGGLSRVSRLTRFPRGVNAQPTGDPHQQGCAPVVFFPPEAQENRRPGPSSNAGGGERGESVPTVTARDQGQLTGTVSGGSHLAAAGVLPRGGSGGRAHAHRSQGIGAQPCGSKRGNVSSVHDCQAEPATCGTARKRASLSNSKRSPPLLQLSNGMQGSEAPSDGLSPKGAQGPDKTLSQAGNTPSTPTRTVPRRISGRLGLASELETLGLIDERQKNRLRYLIYNDDAEVNEALESYDDGDASKLHVLISKGSLNPPEDLIVDDTLGFESIVASMVIGTPH